jgi:hypothetical protein
LVAERRALDTDAASIGSWLPGRRCTGTGTSAIAWRLRRHDASVELVALEDVTADEDERAALVGGERPDATHHVGAGGGEAGLRLAVEEVARHAELPVGGDDEPDHATPPPPSATPSVAARRRLRRG